MRIAIGSFNHESHSFCKDITDIESMKHVVFDDAEHIVEKHRGVHGTGGGAYLGGYVDYAEAHGWDILPLFAAGAYPAGPVTGEAYDYVKGQMLSHLKGQKVDGLVLHLHGASVVEGLDDAEGDLLSAFREMLGEDVPILTILDLHANVSDLMAEKADVILGYNTYPHIDIYEREQEVCRILEKMVSGEAKPVTFRAQPPLLLPAVLTETKAGPMKKIMDRVFAWEKEDGVINVSAFAGYYASDKKEAGPSCIATTDGDPALAEKIAKDVADLFWEIREEFFVKMMPVKEAIAKAKNSGGLWAFIDECDDPMGGGSTDGTYILKALMDDGGIESAGVCTIRDPEIVGKAWEAGVGGTVKGMLGGKIDDLHGDPVPIEARVLQLHDEEIPGADDDPTIRQNVGRLAVIDQNGIIIIVTEKKANTENMNLFAYLGIDVKQFRIMVLKGFGKAYEGVFKDIPAGYIIPDSLGITSPDVRKIGNFQKIRRPVYPLDENVEMRYK